MRGCGGKLGVLLYAMSVALSANSEDVLPGPVTAENFAALRTNSPFRRSVDFSDSLVLTGMARIEGNIYATLFDTALTQSHVVSEMVNAEGWQLVGVRGDEADLESLTAKIQVAGGEVVSIRYEKLDRKSVQGKPGGGSEAGAGSREGQLSQEQIADAKRAAMDPKIGFRGDGYRDSPPPEILEKLEKISPRERYALAQKAISMRNQGVGSDERRRVYSEELDRAVQGRR